MVEEMTRAAGEGRDGEALSAMEALLVALAAEYGTGEPERAGERGSYLPIRGSYIPVRGSYIPIRGEGGVSTIFDQMAFTSLPGAKAAELHIATHGYADPEVPEFSGLLLAGDEKNPYSVLTAQEVYLWNLQARLVTLSACQTGLGKDVESQGNRTKWVIADEVS